MALNLFGGAGRRRNVGRLRSGGDVAVDLGPTRDATHIPGMASVRSDALLVPRKFRPVAHNTKPRTRAR